MSRATTFFVVCVLLCAVGAIPSTSTAQDLVMGEKPPKLHVSKWICGGPVDVERLAGRSIVVVDLWASRCPACLWSTPQRDELARELAEQGVVFVAITEDEPQEVLDAIGPCSDVPLWHIGIDLTGRTFDSLLGAEDMKGVPFSVVVDQNGLVAWKGQPGRDFADIVRKVVTGDWDTQKVHRRMQNEARFAEIRGELQNCSMFGGCDCAEVVGFAEELSRMPLEGDFVGYRGNAYIHAASALLMEECAGDYGKRALEFSESALAESSDPSAWAYDTCAKAHRLAGDLPTAVGYLMKAVDCKVSAGYKQELRQRLKEYLEQRTEQTGLTPSAEEMSKTKAADETETTTAAKKGPNGEPNSSDTQNKLGSSGSLSTEQAIEDLRAMHKLLVRHAGYDDVDWQLHRAGSSWPIRQDAFEEKLRSRSDWPASDLFDVLFDFVAPLEDAHFAMALKEGDPPKVTKTGRRVTLHHPYFSGVRVSKRQDRYLVVDAPAGHEAMLGLEVRGVEIVSVEQAALGVPALFPAVPQERGASEFFLGAFQSEDPKDGLAISLYRANGVPIPAVLPLHRGGAINKEAVEKDAKTWEMLQSSDAYYPTLCVRTCVVDELSATYEETADTLRSEPVVVLDLRGNLGGSDSVARGWLRRFCPMGYRRWGSAIPGMGSDDRQGRLGKCVIPSGVWDAAAGAPEGEAKGPYEGRFFLITDRNVASSGETFSAYAGQIPGAIVLGENTMGCGTYGNADIRRQLPNSGIYVRFGWVKYFVNDVVEFREGVGMFPDYWLDDENPQEAIGRLLGQIAAN